MFVFKSSYHKIFTNEVNKLALAPLDDKRFQFAHSTETLALGHYLINV